MLLRHLYFAQFCLINIVAIALAFAAYFQGWMDGLLAAHLVELSAVICLVFLYGLASCGAKIWRHGVELHHVAMGTPVANSRVGQYLSHADRAGAESRSLHAGAILSSTHLAQNGS
jgi:hypothetical protein